MKLSCLDPEATCKGTTAPWVVIYLHSERGTLEERNCLEGTAVVMCGEGYRDAKFCASQGREIDADGGMGERSTVLMLGHGVVFTSRRSRESPWRS